MSERRVRAGVVCVDAGALLCVRLRDPVTGSEKLFPPGGGIEPGESMVEAAVREAREETGYDVVVDESRERVLRYPFVWADRHIDVTTHFFPARLAGSRDDQAAIEPDAIQKAVVWVPIGELDEALAYDDNIRGAVRALAVGDDDGG